MTPMFRRSANCACKVASLCIVAAALPARAEMESSLNFYGVTGLIDMPSAEMQRDGYLAASYSYFGPISRTTLTFQVLPRLSASFRFLGVRDWNVIKLGDPTDQFDVYYDRSFDVSYQILKESRYVPAVSVGFQDFVGTGVLAGEYLVATKSLTPGLKVTAGLGWGRLGSEGSIGSPFGNRPKVVVGEGGNFNTDQWFRGPAAPFGGVELQVNDDWTLKAEFSSDAYATEAGARKTFENDSPFNFGLEYHPNDFLRLGAYYMYGSEVGLAAHIIVNPRKRPTGGVSDTAPDPVLTRPNRAGDPDAWSPGWVAQADAGPLLMGNISKRLNPDGIFVEALGYTGQVAQIRIRNTRFDAEAQAVGRVARVLTQTLPASVEVFEIVPVVNGMPTSKVTLRRSDIEALEFAPGAAEALRPRVGVENPGAPIAGLAYDPALYAKFTWALAPYTRVRLFDQTAPLKSDLGLRLSGRYEISPGIVISGSATKKVMGNLDDPPPEIESGLHPVRSDVDLYDANADPALDTLTAAWYGYLGKDIYGRVSIGYLERMFGGISAEVLWKPVAQRWALGAEVNYVAQRDTDGGFGFDEYDYRVASGHLSAYYSFGNGFHGQVDVGRYLAGDVGATLSLDREFENGWKVGAFVTKTDASAEDFGSGSFDKGIRIEIPLAWALGTSTRTESKVTLRPFGRDGGARLNVDGRLYDTVRDYHASGLDAQWGRFWK